MVLHEVDIDMLSVPTLVHDVALFADFGRLAATWRGSKIPPCSLTSSYHAQGSTPALRG